MKNVIKIEGRKVSGIAMAVFGLGAGIAVGACGSSSLSADAGDDFSISIGEPPVFDGCESTGDVAEFSWQITEAPADMADDVGKLLTATEVCSFTLESDMEVADLGTWVVELTVTDEGGATASDQVTVTVSE